MLEHRRTLDIRRGLLEREWRQRDDAGRITRLHFLRFVSLADRNALVEAITLVPENYSGRVSVESIIDGRVTNQPDLAHLEPVPELAHLSGNVLESEAPGWSILTVRTLESGIVLAFASASVFHSEGTGAEYVPLGGKGWAGACWEWQAEVGRTYHIDKLVAVYTSRDGPDPGRLATERLVCLHRLGAAALLDEHTRAWAERWKSADVAIGGNAGDQRAIRFAIYHLIASANPEDERVSVGARALTGESYKGHVFWDTDIYMLPFYTFTHPPSARALLMYRYHTLPGACAKARAMGYRGALYPWESTDTGEEASPSFAVTPEGELIPILTGELEQHISADVAYGVWQYCQATGDDRFFVDAGAEIIFQTARFWASRAQLEGDGRYHIRAVIGPDEYHERVDDNAFTNVMAQWNLERGAEAARLLRDLWPERYAALAKQLGMPTEEPDEWLVVARGMYTGFDPATGLFEQFHGYFGLEHVDLSAYKERSAPMDVLLGRERTARTQIIKQPDVVMLIYLLWDRFPPEVRQANFRYYEPRCGHGSSLSPSIHALVAARLGDRALAARYFRQAAEIDLANNMGNASGGVHAAAQGGLWQAVTFGFAGMRLREDGLAFDPRPLPRWQMLTFPVHWRGRRLRIVTNAAPRTIDVWLEQGGPMTVVVGGDATRAVVETAKRYHAEAQRGIWRRWQVVPR